MEHLRNKKEGYRAPSVPKPTEGGKLTLDGKEIIPVGEEQTNNDGFIPLKELKKEIDKKQKTD